MNSERQRRAVTVSGIFRRSGMSFVEILVALVIMVVVFLPLMSGFITSIRQTHAVRSYGAGRAVADAAIAFSRTEIMLGTVVLDADVDMTDTLRALVGATMEHLQDVTVLRTIAPIGDSGRLFSVEVTVTWQDPNISTPRRVSVRTLERPEV